jgi:hypothetical protein
LTGADEVGVLLGAEITRLIRFGADGSGTVTAAWRRTGDSMPGRSRIAIDDIVAAPVRESGIPARITEQSPPELAPGSCSAVGAPIKVGGSEACMAEFTEPVATAIANAQDRADLVASRAFPLWEATCSRGQSG